MRRYYKRFAVGELDALSLPLEEEALSFNFANNALLIQYAKPKLVLDYERDKAKERRALLAKAKEEGRLEQQGSEEPGQCKQQ